MSVGDELEEIVQMLHHLPAEVRDGVVRVLDGAPRVERQASAQRFRPLPSLERPSRACRPNTRRGALSFTCAVLPTEVCLCLRMRPRAEIEEVLCGWRRDWRAPSRVAGGTGSQGAASGGRQSAV